MRRAAALLCALVMPLAATAQRGAAPAPPVAVPADVPLVEATDRALVQANCSGCHSLRLVTAQRGDRDTWLRLIRWMQETQNLWTFAPEIEARILDYLAENYPPGGPTRRAPLPEHLLPPRR